MKQTEFWSTAYLAAPFFSPEQLKRIEHLEHLCERSRVLAFSPRKFMVLKPRAPLTDRQKVFDSNCQHIDQADIVLACTEWLDSGTSWEMGYAHAKGKPVIIYNWTDRPLNVMLAVGSQGVLRNAEQVENFVTGHQCLYAEVESTGKLWDYNWEVAHRWLNEIY